MERCSHPPRRRRRRRRFSRRHVRVRVGGEDDDGGDDGGDDDDEVDARVVPMTLHRNGVRHRCRYVSSASSTTKTMLMATPVVVGRDGDGDVDACCSPLHRWFY